MLVSFDVLVKEFRGAIAHRYTRTDVGAFIESISGAFAVGPIRRTYRSEVPGIFHRAPTHTAPTFQATFARFSSLSPLAAMRRGTSALRGITNANERKSEEDSGYGRRGPDTARAAK